MSATHTGQAAVLPWTSPVAGAGGSVSPRSSAERRGHGPEVSLPRPNSGTVRSRQRRKRPAVRNRTRGRLLQGLSTRTTARLRRNRDATPLALPHTRPYRGCRSEGSSNAHAGVVDRRPVPRTGRRVRRRIHAPGPRQRNHRDAIALVEHGALDWDCSRGRPTCAGVDLPRATDVLLTGTNATKRRAAGPDTGGGLVSKRSPSIRIGSASSCV
jgi:hypothetical protein